MNIRKKILIAIPVVIAAIGLFLFSRLPESDVVRLEGSVEISTSTYFSRVGAVAVEVCVEPGETVKEGDVLAVLDDQAIDNEMAQLEETLVIKNAKLNQLSEGPKMDGIDAARKSARDSVKLSEAQLSLAESALSDAQKDLETQRQLFGAGVISKAELEQYERTVRDRASAVSSARAQLSAAQNNVNTIVYPEKDDNDLDAAMADVRLTELQIEKLESDRANYTITAQNSGIVVDKNIEKGAMAMAGQALFEVSNEGDKYFVFYLPADQSNRLNFGDEIPLYRVNGRSQAGKATVCFMDWKAVYTPKDFESSANKNKKSIKVKALIESQESLAVGETLVTDIALSTLQ